MNIRQHIPNFCDGFKREEAKFNSQEELLSIGFIKNWTENPLFKRFSVSIHDNLMAEMGDNSFWVVGYLSGENCLTFPKFIMSK